MGQFNLPKSNRMLPPKKVNAVLDMQSDAAVGMPTKAPGKKFGLPKSSDVKAMKMKSFDKDKDKM